MKNNRLNRTALAIAFVLISFLFKSDVIPENSHPVQRKVVITNCDDFQDIQLFGYITGVMVPSKNIYLIENNQELTKGYKFNTLYIGCIKKSTLVFIGGINNLTEQYILSKTTPKEFLSSAVHYFDNSTSLEKDELFYEIIKISENTIKVELRKRILTFDDDTKTINY